MHSCVQVRKVAAAMLLADILLQLVGCTSSPAPTLTAEGCAVQPFAPDWSWTTRPLYGNQVRPVVFEENKGQLDKTVLYQASFPAFTVSLTATGALLHLSAPATSAVNLELSGIEPSVTISPGDIQPAVRSYSSTDHSTSYTDVHSFGLVSYQHVYPGVDLSYYGDSDGLHFDFTVAAHADANNIHLRLTAAAQVVVENNSVIFCPGEGGHYQLVSQFRRPLDQAADRLDANYNLSANGEITYKLPDYDNSKALVISNKIRALPSVLPPTPTMIIDMPLPLSWWKTCPLSSYVV